MKPIIYEMRRVIISKPVLLILLSIIIIPAAIAVYSASAPGPSDYINSQAFAEGGNGTYNISIYFSDEHGVPWVDTPVNLTVDNVTTQHHADSAGYVYVTLHDISVAAMERARYLFESNIGGPPLYQNNTIPIVNNQTNPYFIVSTVINPSTGVGNTTLYTSRYSMTDVVAKNNQREEVIFFSFYRADLVSYPNVYLYYAPVSSGTEHLFSGGGTATYYGNLTNLSALAPFARIPRSEMTFYGEFNTFPTFVVNPSNLTSISNSTEFTFELFSTNGTEIGYVQIQLVNNPTANVNTIFFTSELPILSLFVPLMAMFSSYLTFARDKCSGVLSSVIVRPLSRRSLLTSRYVSNVSTIFMGSAASLGLSSLIFYEFLGLYIPPNTILLTLWALFVMIGAFTALVFLAGNLFRTQGQIIGFILIVFFGFDFLWTFPSFSIIPDLIATSLLGEYLGSLHYFVTITILNYISPSGFTNLITYLVQGTIGSFMFGFYPPSRIGITVPIIISAGILWVIAPLLVAFKIFTKRD